MKRIDIIIALGTFLLLVGIHFFNHFRGAQDQLIDSFVASAFGALLTLFQQRARLETHIDDASIAVTNEPAKESN
jgi:hypothetical protein